MTHDVLIIGGGIVGLATARALGLRNPGLRIALLEKESFVAAHQTGHNSGVIHSGIYYKPGSLKAQLCVRGAAQMYDFCEAHEIAHKRCGKIIVATAENEIGKLDELQRRANENGVPGVERIDARQIKEIEPNAAGIAGLWSPNTGIADYRGVSEALKFELEQRGTQVRLIQRVEHLRETATDITVHTQRETFTAQHVISCAGLHADRIARMLGLANDVQIVPFRGEYFFIKPAHRHLVKGLIYPVPDPNFPFLGVHFTISTSGAVEAGPNAVLAFAREGYAKSALNPGELAQTLGFPGFQTLAAKWWRTGAYEIYRSLNKSEFVRSLQKLVPAITADDVERGGAGVRAQAVSRAGALIDDFYFAESARSLHVLNAPSPAATASLAIGAHVADRAATQFGL